MKAEIARFHSPDVDDLFGFEPPDPDDVGILLQVMAGPAGIGGEESFDVLVCTPKWFLRSRETEVAAPGRHTILITRYDWCAIEQHVRGVVEVVRGDDWRAVAEELDRCLGRWEFMDYTS